MTFDAKCGTPSVRPSDSSLLEVCRYIHTCSARATALETEARAALAALAAATHSSSTLRHDVHLLKAAILHKFTIASDGATSDQ